MPMLGPRGSADRRRAHGSADADMRVSDAERAEVADRLAQHYGDGRLDQAELDERLSRAMSAKTQADLYGLFDDLPEPEINAGASRAVPPPRVTGPRAGRPRRKLLPIVLVAVLIVAVWNMLPHWWFPWGIFGFWFGGPWLWIALIGVCWLLGGPWRRRR